MFHLNSIIIKNFNLGKIVWENAGTIRLEPVITRVNSNKMLTNSGYSVLKL